MSTPREKDKIMEELREKRFNARLKWRKILFTDEPLSEEDYQKLKAHEQALKEKRKLPTSISILIPIIYVVIIFLIFGLVKYLGFGEYFFASDELELIFTVLASVALVPFLEITIGKALGESEEDLMRLKIIEYELSHALEQTQEDPFRNSIKTSYTYLNRYYDQIQQQAKNGFRITMRVAIFGAGLISFGVLLLFFGDSEKITPAYITCASGVITEFISSIFFAMYNKTVTSMNSYHDKLVLSQNVAFALRVASDIQDEIKRDDAKLAIINELVKDVNAQMMKSDNADADEPPKKDKPSADEQPS